MAVRSSALAFGIPVPLEVWTAESTLGESSPRPGLPTSSARTDGSYPDWILSAAGEQTAGTTVSVKVIEPGYPPAAGVAIKEAADSVWKGRNTPLHRARTLPLQAGGAPLPVRIHPHGVVTPSGTRIVAFTRQVSGGAYAVVVAYRTATATSWSTVDVATGLSTTYPAYPALVVMDRGVQLFHWVIDDDNDVANIDVYQTLNDGATWTRSARSVLQTDAIDISAYDLGRIRVAYRQGQLSLLAHLRNSDALADPRERVNQYASADGGAHLTLISEIDYLAFPDIAVYDGRFVCVFANESTTFLEARVIANAYMPLDTTPADSAFEHGYNAMFTVTSNLIDDCDHALAVSENGLYWLARAAGSAGSTEQSCQIVRMLGAISDRNIFNMGRDSFVASGYGAWWIQDAAATATDYPINFCAWFWRGCLQVAHNLESSSTQWDDQIFLTDLGGNSSVMQPLTRRIGSDVYQASARRTYFASSLPTVARYGWVATGAGTADITTTAGWLRIATAAQQKYYEWTYTPSVAEVRYWGYLRSISGGSVTTDDISVGLRLAQAGLGFEVRLRVGASSVRLYDVNGAAAVATTSVDTTAGIYFVIALDENGACYAAVAPATNDGDQVFAVLSNGTTVTDDAGAGGTDNVWMMGNRSVGTATSEFADVSIWYTATSSPDVDSLASGQTNPDDLRSIPLSSSTATYADAGISIRARGGRMILGDTWSIAADSAAPQRALIPRGYSGSARAIRGGDFPSPRTVTTATATTGRWAFRVPTHAEQRFPRGVLLVDLQGANFGSCQIEGYASAAWSTIGTWSGQSASLSFSREGGRLRPSGTSTTYLRTNELASIGYVKLTSGPTTVVRPVSGNTGGIWTTAGTSPLPVIDIDPAAYTGTEPSSGTLTIYYGRGTLVVPIAETTQYEAFCIRFTIAPSIYESYPRLGKVTFAEGWLLDSPDRGASRTREYGALIEEADNGATRAKVLRPDRDVRETPFTRVLVDGLKAQGGSVWTIETSGANVALTGADAEVIEGMMSTLQQGVIPGVFVPFISGSGGTRTLVSDLAGVYGRPVMDELTFSLEHGTEGSRMVSGARLVWRGEL